MTLASTAIRQLSSLPASLRRFANADVVCQGWYCVGSARRIARAEVRRVWIGRRDLVLYRDLDGTLRAAGRACAHLGADLTQATVVRRGLQCAFHRWCWGPDGSCAAGGGISSGARLRTYEVRERWGLAWVWAGGAPAYDLPMPAASNQAHVLRLPPQHLSCHAHVVLGNGLDVTHVVPVHRFRFERDPLIEQAPPHRLAVQVQARFDTTLLRRLVGIARRSAAWRFTTIGPSLAWVTVTSPISFELVWAARPLPDGGCSTQTIFFLPRWATAVRALPMMVATTWADRRILNGLEFRPGFVASDAVFARYAELVEAMPEW